MLLPEYDAAGMASCVSVVLSCVLKEKYCQRMGINCEHVVEITDQLVLDVVSVHSVAVCGLSSLSSQYVTSYFQKQYTSTSWLPLILFLQMS